MGLLKALLNPNGEDDGYKTLGQRIAEDSAKRHEELRIAKEEGNKRMHAKAIAYENYLYHSNTPEEKAINRSIWLNL